MTAGVILVDPSGANPAALPMHGVAKIQDLGDRGAVSLQRARPIGKKDGCFRSGCCPVPDLLLSALQARSLPRGKNGGFPC